MHRIGLALAAILLLPIAVASAAWLLSWPIEDKLYYLSIGLGSRVVCLLSGRSHGGLGD